MSRKVRTFGFLMDACLVLFLGCAGLMVLNIASQHWVYAFINAAIAFGEVKVYRLYARLIEQQIKLEQDFGELMRKRLQAEHV